jgi:pilus assembly protein Flp/PilA
MISGELTRFWKEENGQDMVEYSLLLGFITLAVVGLLTSIRTSISGIYTTLSTTLSTGAS